MIVLLYYTIAEIDLRAITTSITILSTFTVTIIMVKGGEITL